MLTQDRGWKTSSLEWQILKVESLVLFEKEIGVLLSRVIDYILESVPM